LLPVFSLLGGCYFMRSLPLGPPAPIRARCTIRHEELTPDDAGAKYRQVGEICLIGAPEDEQDRPLPADRWSFDMRTDFEHHACALGADVVVPIRTCEISKTPGVAFGVYRDRDR
jgi:hypothetical protein